MKNKRFPILLSITAGLATLASLCPAADYNPIAFYGYNHDMIVEKNAPAPLVPGGQPGAPTTASMDGGIGNNGDTWNEQGYFTQDAAVGLPPAGSTITTNNYQFTLAPSYTAPNAIMLDVGYFTNANFKLNTPAAYGAISFLTSGGNGGCQFRVTAQRLDGTTSSGTAASPDWFSVPNNIAWIANGRVQAQTFTLDNYNSANPRLYSADVALSASASPITNLFIEYVSGNASGHSCIMAISGAAAAGGSFTPILGTGYNADIVVEAAYPERWDLAGTVSSTSATMDGGVNNTGNTWFEQGYYVNSNTFGIPAPGSTLIPVDAPDHQFKMPASYTDPNAIFLDQVNSPGVVVLLDTPATYSGLSFLGASGNGALTVEVVISHQDTTQQTQDVSIPDWFNVSPIALTANGRINATSGIFENLNSGNPRLYAVDFPVLNTSSPITSLQLNWKSGAGRTCILAMSGTAGAVKPVFTIQPVSIKTNSAVTVAFTAAASGTAPVTLSWQKGTNGVFVNLADGGNISGANTGTLQLGNISMADLADYRAIAANAAGSATSAVATLTIISTLNDVTAPGDSITGFGGTWPNGENPTYSIDNTTSKYLNFGGNGGAPFLGPVGFTVTPAIGRTIVSGIRLYNANDAVERDPAQFKLEGSNDGANFTVIAEGPLALPDGRNDGGLALDPLAQNIQQVLFANTMGFSVYKLSFATVKVASANAMQIGEVELLGVADTSGYPTITRQPTNVTVYVGANAQFVVAASGTPAPTYQWRKLVGGVMTDIAGATSPTLSLSTVAFSDATQYSVLVKNSVGEISSLPATLTVLSTLLDVTSSADTITGFGDTAGTYWPEVNRTPLAAFDDTMTKHQNGGSGFSAPAGFPPFVGPVGVIVTPLSPTIISGIRIYTADGDVQRDPADYEVEGSTDGGVTWQFIASGSLSLPERRNAAADAMDPLTSAMQEVLFPSRGSCSSYRITFQNARNNSTAQCLQFAELELLGVTSTGVSPVVTVAKGTGGSLVITSSQPGTLQSSPTLGATAVWTNEGPITGTITITPQAGVDAKFYRVVVP